ncbi:MAG: polyketide cyclase [Gammaproteobacteria bacterium]|nr:polyketide cyclase [Gammaproteobacteria bacterium]
MTLQNAPVVNAQMLIRRPVAEVFTAFVDPAITTQFWFTRSSGKLEQGKKVIWDWEMYGVSMPVTVKALEEHTRILIEWGEPATPVEWTFGPRPDNTTMVSITASGFHGTDDEMVAMAIDSMGGFSYLLASLKALLEHDVALNLVADHHPDAHVGDAS